MDKNFRKFIKQTILEVLSSDEYSIDDNFYLYQNGRRIYSSNSKKDLIHYLKHNNPELLSKLNLIEPLKVNRLGDKLTLFRGVGYNEGGNFYSPSKEFAMEFTRTGRESELLKMVVDKNRIYKHDPLPRGYGREDENFDIAIEQAKSLGLNAIWVDEGQNQPDSVFVINPKRKV